MSASEVPIVAFVCSPLHAKNLPGWTPTIKAVLDALVYFAGRGYECSPLRAEIAEESGVSIGSVVKSLGWLKRNGIIAEVKDPSVVARRRFVLLWRRRSAEGRSHQQSSAHQVGASAHQMSASANEVSASAHQECAPSLYGSEKEEEKKKNNVNVVSPEISSSDQTPDPGPTNAAQPPGDRWAEATGLYSRLHSLGYRFGVDQQGRPYCRDQSFRPPPPEDLARVGILKREIMAIAGLDPAVPRKLAALVGLLEAGRPELADLCAARLAAEWDDLHSLAWHRRTFHEAASGRRSMASILDALEIATKYPPEEARKVFTRLVTAGIQAHEKPPGTLGQEHVPDGRNTEAEISR